LIADYIKGTQELNGR